MAAAAASGGLSLFAAESASATVTPSQRFALEGNGGYTVLGATLHQPYWAMQSFAFDHVNGHIYFAQTKVGSANGDLWMTRTDLSGKVLGAMALHGFDHGSSMAIEPDTSGSPYVWLAGDWRSLSPNTAPNSHTICRFKYSDGGVLDYADAEVRAFPIGLSDFLDCPRPSIDPSTNRLLIRYMGTTSPWRLALFDLPAVINKGISDSTPILTKRALPTNAQLHLSDSDDFQGVTSYGQYAYLSYGGPPKNPSDPAKPSYLVTLDMNNTGDSVKQLYPTKAGETTLPGREPQGTAIWLSSGGPRLAFGFSSKISGSPDQFRASVFYKSDLIE